MAEFIWQATAAANILDARKRKGRLGNKKSRGGCLTCKLRHVKCDETPGQPDCMNCFRTGRNCDGYANSPSPGYRKNRNSLIGLQLSQSLGLKENDRRVFDYFLSWTAPRLAGALDREFWCGQALQLAHAEPVILDSLLAISTLYEHPQYMKSFFVHGEGNGSTASSPRQSSRPLQSGISLPRPSIDKHHALGLNYYNRAIRGLREKMALGGGTPLLALLSCILFICIEVIRDNVFAALSLLVSGTKLLRELDTAESDMDQRTWCGIKFMFGRLGVIAAFYGHRGPLQLSSDLMIYQSPEGPFSSLIEARIVLFKLIAGSHSYFLATLAFKENSGISPTSHHDAGRSPVDKEDSSTVYSPGTWPQSVAAETEPAGITAGVTRLYYGVDNAYEMDDQFERIEIMPSISLPVPPSLVDEQDRLRHRLDGWLHAFQQSHKDDNEAALGLLMLYHISYIWLSSRLSLYETVFDQFTRNFQEVLRLAEIYVRCKSERPTFTFEIGAIGPLYFVATKCRVPSLRRKAVELMHKAPKKESVWGANSCAEFASRIISIEEESLADLSPPSSVNSTSSSPMSDVVLPSECSRIHAVEILRTLPSTRTEIRVIRYSFDSEGRRIKSVLDYPL